MRPEAQALKDEADPVSPQRRARLLIEPRDVLIEDLDTLPFPARDLLGDASRYVPPPATVSSEKMRRVPVPRSTATTVKRGAEAGSTVYDALVVLAEHGVIRRIQPAGSPARYEDRVGDNHHHLICRRCDRMVDVDCAIGAAPCLTAADASGYEIDEAEVVYWGRCPGCRKRAAGTRTRASTAKRRNSTRGGPR